MNVATMVQYRETRSVLATVEAEKVRRLATMLAASVTLLVAGSVDLSAPARRTA